MYLRNLLNYQSMNLVYSTSQGNQIWLGDYYAATNLQLLQEKKINSVFTTAAMLGIKYPKQLNINHKVIKAFDSPTYKMTPHFDEAYKFIKESLSKGNILVHCAAGISRSTTCVLVYLMRAKGYSFKHSLQMVKNKRSKANPNYGFQQQLVRYEKKLKNMKIDKQQNHLRVQQKQINDVEQEKKAVFDFINGQNCLNKTLGNKNNNNRYYGKSTHHKQTNKNQIIKKQQKNLSYKRGQSLNYRPTMTNSNISNRQKANQPFLTYKLQQPKIVTIKK